MEWEFEPGVVALLLLPAALYAVGQRKQFGLSRGQKVLFWSGMASLAFALMTSSAANR